MTFRKRAFLWAVAFVALGVASCSHPLPPPKPYLAVVASRGSRSLAVVNLATFKRQRIIPLSFAPERLFVRPQSKEIYVISRDGSGVIHFPQFEVTKLPSTASGVTDMAFSSDGSRAYFLKESKIIVFDFERSQVLKTLPLASPLVHLALTPDGKTLIGEGAAKSQLVFWDAGTGEKLGAADLGKDPGSMVILPHNRKVFVADQGEDTITAVDIPSRQVLSNIEIAAPPRLLALKPDGGEIFAFSPANSTLTILDASHDNVEQSFPTGKDPVAAVFKADSSVLYISNAGDGSVTALDVPNRTVMATTRIGVEPGALALTPDERFLAVVDSGGASLAVVRAGSCDLVTTIPVGADPVDVVVPGWLM